MTVTEIERYISGLENFMKSPDLVISQEAYHGLINEVIFWKCALDVINSNRVTRNASYGDSIIPIHTGTVRTSIMNYEEGDIEEGYPNTSIS